jgi:hypothetical protein
MTDLQELMALSELAAQGEWMLATSCSWRRVLTQDGRPVIVPTTQRSDNHPDMECGPDYVNAELSIAAVNYLRSPAFAKMAANARRYEWLRKSGMEIAWNAQVSYSPGYMENDAEAMDAAIDAAASGGG